MRLRLDNFTRAKKNADFVTIELDSNRKGIQTLAEMAVNRQDPDFLSSQVDLRPKKHARPRKRSASCSI